jgi:hypothetical protein
MGYALELPHGGSVSCALVFFGGWVSALTFSRSGLLLRATDISRFSKIKFESRMLSRTLFSIKYLTDLRSSQEKVMQHEQFGVLEPDFHAYFEQRVLQSLPAKSL